MAEVIRPGKMLANRSILALLFPNDRRVRGAEEKYKIASPFIACVADLWIQHMNPTDEGQSLLRRESIENWCDRRHHVEILGCPEIELTLLR